MTETARTMQEQRDESGTTPCESDDAAYGSPRQTRQHTAASNPLFHDLNPLNTQAITPERTVAFPLPLVDRLRWVAGQACATLQEIVAQGHYMPVNIVWDQEAPEDTPMTRNPIVVTLPKEDDLADATVFGIDLARNFARDVRLVTETGAAVITAEQAAQLDRTNNPEKIVNGITRGVEAQLSPGR